MPMARPYTRAALAGQLLDEPADALVERLRLLRCEACLVVEKLGLADCRARFEELGELLRQCDRIAARVTTNKRGWGGKTTRRSRASPSTPPGLARRPRSPASPLARHSGVPRLMQLREWRPSSRPRSEPQPPSARQPPGRCSRPQPLVVRIARDYMWRWQILQRREPDADSQASICFFDHGSGEPRRARCLLLGGLRRVNDEQARGHHAFLCFGVLAKDRPRRAVKHSAVTAHEHF